jgi:hypothetical protein
VVQYRGPLAFYQINQLIVNGVSAALSDSLGGPVERACVVPGNIAWDSCDCGLLAVSTRRWFVTDDFPAGNSGGSERSTPCDQPWLIGEIVAQVVRCAPSPEGVNIISVPCSELDAAAQILLSDAYVVITEMISILCELRETDQIVDYTLNQEETVGPEGGCVGVEISASVALYR